METIGKTALELEALVMSELRKNQACANVTGVRIGPTASGASWQVIGYRRDGAATVRPECQRAGIEAASALRRKFHLLTDD